MAWLNEEYADEFAVLTTWLAALLPWSISWGSDPATQSLLVFFRLPIVDFQLRFPTEVTVDGQVIETTIPQRLAEQYGGIDLVANAHVVFPPSRLGAVDGTHSWAYLAWSVATVVFLIAFVLSLAMYWREDAVQARLPVEYATLTAGLFGVLAVLLGVATIGLFQAGGAYGTPIPIGVVLLGAFAVLLWRAERVPSTG